MIDIPPEPVTLPTARLPPPEIASVPLPFRVRADAACEPLTVTDGLEAVLKMAVSTDTGHRPTVELSVHSSWCRRPNCPRHPAR